MVKDLYEQETIKYFRTLTLLCVEDSKSTQSFYKAIFDSLFKRVLYAYDGVEGYEKFLEYKVDLIITDYTMPKLNGLEMVKKIKKTDDIVPIVFVSSLENFEIIVSLLNHGVNHFVKKPADTKEILLALEDAAKILIANETLERQNQKERYRSYQEDMGFEKELNILRNDFYYQMMDDNTCYLVDFLYKPLDILSGDAYCARRITQDSTFYLMVDGMGKGLSASLTAMIMASFTNHVIDRMLELDSFDLSVLVHETMEYIKPIILEEESLALDYILIDNDEATLYYAKFAMPVLLMENSKGELVRIKSNNAPLSKWQDSFIVGSYDISDIKKFLIYSDGLVENETKYDNKPYIEFIEQDFLDSFTREDLKKSFFEKITEQEDDITLIYIHNMKFDSDEIVKKSFETNLENIDASNEWYENIWKTISSYEEVSYRAGLTFTELFMNAYEHGNLGMDSEEKHAYLESGEYFDILDERSQECSKKIEITINKIQYKAYSYIVTQITDEGEGFDTQILTKIFRNSAAFNGRGVFVSRKNSLGIYYNSKGNSVLFLNKVKEEH